MKRKGRRRQPKAGTTTDRSWEHREGVAHLEHPFADDPSASGASPWAKVVAVIVAVALVASLVGWLILSV